MFFVCKGEKTMKTSRIFKNGNNQAVRIPKEFCFDGNEVYVKQCGDVLVLVPKNEKWTERIQASQEMSDDMRIDSLAMALLAE